MTGGKAGFPSSVWCQEASLPNNPSSEAQTEPNHPLVFYNNPQPLQMLQRGKKGGFSPDKPWVVRRYRRPLHVGKTDLRQLCGPGSDKTLAVLRRAHHRGNQGPWLLHPTPSANDLRSSCQ